MTIITNTAVTTGHVLWTEVDVDLWVAHIDGAFGGSIDSSDGHAARDPFGRDRGTFDTFDEARRHLESFLAHPAMAHRLRIG
ncbi:hypothetical protein [uncultured Microbacterium sp.]|uniref:hypothetical protein n=1 Tax=uncultured Microbacterium sp. TaxID=191216 RepID=UPI00261A5FBF|nr:hypothetical protein [uncultured Microbacterium sp.]